MIREFRLAPAGAKQGVSCDSSGAFVGMTPLLERSQEDGRDRWEPRDCEQLSKQIGSDFGLPIDMSSKRGGLKAICNALNEGDVARAQIATVLLGIPDPPPLDGGARSRDTMIKFIRDLHWSGMIAWDDAKADAHCLQSRTTALSGSEDALVKAGYNSDEPRDWHGDWTRDGGSDGDIPNADIAVHSDDAVLDSAVYHPGIDPVDLEDVGDPKQLLLNQLRHRAQVQKEMAQWRKKGFWVTPNVMFVDPRTDTPIVSDYVVSIWVPDPDGFLLFPKPEPILVRDVKTGEGGRTPNQKQVYPYMLAGGKVVPVGRNAFIAGFVIGEPTNIAEMYVEGDLPSDTVH